MFQTRGIDGEPLGAHFTERVIFANGKNSPWAVPSGELT